MTSHCEQSGSGGGAYESYPATEERKRAKRVEKARAHSLRQSQTRTRNAERLELLAVLARLSAAERLSRFAMDPTLNLDCVPPELIPSRVDELGDVETATAVALVVSIPAKPATHSGPPVST